ncbi:alpha/beta fold hydrolase [Amycolatopsis australiensis]|uniref:Pimeloyl-ACP methyl ester carboxylesterase n=1 Tax=Amycolatopsis australiensis TaxID=546364 RepID=A0A1K1QXG6_9PSEU|nr:alpha/beta fold hydrolase [Amycolatopsis australiensis]SFW64568.1 Pimeloyl-ACP methyl ester carboxylesterase [Amycolatopsis australiensis]
MNIYKSEAGARLLRERYLEALAAWPVAHERLRIPTAEGETFALASGPESAPPLVLLHGSGSNSAEWAPRIASLAERFRVYAVDVIGEPGLSAETRPPLKSDRYALWLDAVLDHVGVTRAAFLGSSLGGWLALDYATRRPGRVAALALRCPAGLGPMKKGFAVKAVLLTLLGERGRRRAMAGALGEPLSSPVVAHQLVVAAHYRYRGGPPVFGDAALARLTMPVYAVAGAEDAMVGSAPTKRRLEAAGARVDVLPGTGHYFTASPELAFLTEVTANGDFTT